MTAISNLLLPWYDAHKRRLPWRDISDPYATWVSETMLQQTRVETVLSYYERFMAQFPTVQALASAPEEDVLKAWEGLGYYSRARNLQKGARQVVGEWGGVLPRTVEELEKITGIGPYTAGAIASIAFDQPVAAVDGNVIRVCSRVAGIREDVAVPSVLRRVKAAAQGWVPDQRAGDFAQSVMDLGATVCTPGTPDCAACPLQAVCDACAAGDAEELPRKTRAAAPKEVLCDVLLIRREGAFLMHPRTEKLLQGLWVFPMLEGRRSAGELEKELRRQLKVTAVWRRDLGPAKHVFTHRVWQMQVHLLDWEAGEIPQGMRFVTSEEMENLPLPTAMRKAKEAAKENVT